MTVTWPADLIPRRCNPELRNAAKSGGVSLSGQEQRVFSSAARWEVDYEFSIHSTAQVNAWRAMVGRVRQGEDILVTVFDLHKPGNFGANNATLAAAAGLRATTLQLAGSDVQIDAGQHISLGGSRLHLVTDVGSETQTNTGTVAAVSGSSTYSDVSVWVDLPTTALTITITPPTRTSYADGATVNLNVLKLRCVLKDINGGDLGLDLGRYSNPTITFSEVIL